MARIDYTTDPDVDERLNPASEQTSKYLNSMENNAANDNFYDGDKKDDGLNAADSVNSQEQLYSRSPLGKAGGKKRGNLLANMSRRKWGATAGIGGGLFGLMMLFFTILPYKLDAMVSTITDQLSSVPQHAINQRLEYITTRWVAMKMMQTAYPGDANLVFCAGGGVLCHLGATKYSTWFEEQLDAKFEKEGRNVKAVFNASGRNTLGGKATSFTMHLESKDMNSVLQGVEKELSHKDMRRHIKKMTRKVHGRNYFMRYLSKRVLYRKYGVKKFNIIPEKAGQKYADFKAKIKLNMNTRITAKMSPRFAAYLGCLDGTDAKKCQDTLDKLNNDLDSKISEAEKEAEKATGDNKTKADEKVKKVKGQKEALNNIDSLSKAAPDTPLGKIISKQLFKKIAAANAIIGAIDLVAKIVGAVNEKVIEIVGADQKKQLYTAFTYDEEASPVLTRDQIRAGTIDNIQHVELATSLFDGAEAAPIFQATFGGNNTAASLLYPTAYAEDGGIRTKCEVGGEEKVVALDPGELVCPEKKIVKDYTTFTKYPVWRVLAGIAEAWNSTFGAIIDFVGDTVGKVFSWFFSYLQELPGLKQLVELSEGLIEKAMGWAVSLLFGIPEVGVDAPGNNNFEALHGGLTTTMQSSTEAGQAGADSGSKQPDGIGGARLTNQQVSVLAKQIEQEHDEEFREQPLMAKLFDPTLKRSVAGQLLAVMPTSGFSTARLLARAPIALASAITPTNTHAAKYDQAAVMRAFGVTWHGFTDEAVYKADPSQYTDAVCSTKAKEREASYGIHEGDLVPTYSVADPCALELTVAGNLALMADDKEGKYYPKEIDDPSANTGAQQPSSGPVGDAIGPPELEEAQTFGNEPASWGGHRNGEIPLSAMSELKTAPGHYMHPKAAQAFDAMNEAYAQEHGGQHMTITESYRTLATQQDYFSSGITQATPGTSKHGHGLALDINIGGSGFNTPIYLWLASNASKYGFVNPPWARDRNNPGWYKDEPWHWDYARRVQ